MDAVATRRLPGVYFQVVQPPPESVLPRMDVAGFVGFAAKGPVNRPVAVEDPKRFRDLFGGELPLVWDPRERRYETACLAPAVEAFFRNGGRRCWVVRVAEGAATNRFPLFGLLDAESGRPALIDARSPGSWSDALRAGTVLSREVLGVRSAGAGLALHDDGTYEVTLETRPDRVRLGDVLRIAYEAGEELYLTVARRVRLESGGLRFTGIHGRWFRTRLGAEDSLPDPFITRNATAVLISGSGEAADAVLPSCAVTIPTGAAAAGYDVLFEDVPAVVPRPGDVLHLTVSENPPEQRELWLLVREAHSGPGFTSEDVSFPPGSPPEDVASLSGATLRIEASDGLWPMRINAAQRAALVESLEDASYTVERLTMSLLAWHRQEVQARMDELGLSGWLDLDDESRRFAENASGAEVATRFWGLLPDDDALFSLKAGLPIDEPRVGSLEREAFEPRFPFAGSAEVAPLFIPLSMPGRPDPTLALGPVPDGLFSALERDGLTNFRAGMFLDRDLLDVRLGSFSALAEDKLHIRRQALGGLHSLLPVEEVTLVSVPDAVHRGWVFQEAESIPLLAAPEWTPGTPEWLDGPTKCLPGVYRLCWTAGPHADLTYEVEESPHPDFTIRVVRYRGEQVCTNVLFDAGCSKRLYYRVRARQEDRFSPWSATLAIVVPETDFTGALPLTAPVVSTAIDHSPPEAELRWTSVGPDVRYVLQTAFDPAFTTAVEIKRSDPSGLSYRLDPLPESVAYFRVRAERSGDPGDERGPWSETMVFEPASRSDWIARSPASFHDPDSRAPGELLALHRALLRFCAARGDVVAVLSLPSHYREEEAFAHVAALTPNGQGDDRFPLPATVHVIPPLSLDEGRALSYGALYHPWTAVRTETRRETRIRFSPPDGAVTGLIAARAISRGAWISPANVPLADVVAVDPEVEPAAWQEWLNVNVNVLKRDPRGFCPMSADTLSASGALRPLGVRRLMILLRRLALREGNTLVFESNSAELRRRVRLQFLSLLSDMFERGAFVGATPSEAFRIETGPAVNTPESIDRGRLIVELRVAPSRPLAFITVRLIQRSGAGFNVEEF